MIARLLLFIGLGLILIAGVTVEAVDTSSSVVDLTSANFEAETTGDIFVEFYAPYCGHCKRLAPIWEDLGRALHGRAKIGRVDCTVETDLAKRFPVKGFPTLLLLRNGAATYVEYLGPRSIESFITFLTSHNVLSQGPIELRYFDTRGRAEAVRIMLADLGVQFTDTRIPRDEWTTWKPKLVTEGKAQFGQVPSLSFGSTHLVQSHAILRFLARQYGVHTDSHDVDMITDGFEDLRRRYGTLVYDKDWQSKVAEYRDTTLPQWLGHYEKWLSQHSSAEEGHAVHFVDDRLSWADYAGFDLLDAQLRLFPSCLESYPLLAAFHKTFASRPNLAVYLASPRRTNTPQNGVSAFIDNPSNPAPLLL